MGIIESFEQDEEENLVGVLEDGRQAKLGRITGEGSVRGSRSKVELDRTELRIQAKRSEKNHYYFTPLEDGDSERNKGRQEGPLAFFWKRYRHQGYII